MRAFAVSARRPSTPIQQATVDLIEKVEIPATRSQARIPHAQIIDARTNVD